LTPARLAITGQAPLWMLAPGPMTGAALIKHSVHTLWKKLLITLWGARVTGQ